MPPRRKPRADDDDNPVMSRSQAAVSSELPALATRFDTSYGSAPSTVPRNSRRGQIRNIQDIVQDALEDDDDSEEDRSARVATPRQIPRSKPNTRSATKRGRPARPPPAPQPEPEPELEPESEPEPEPEPEPQDPDFGADYDPDSNSGSPPRDPTPEPPSVRSSPQRSPSRTAATVEPPAFPPAPLAATRRPPVLPTAAPPRGSHPSPNGPAIGRAASQEPRAPPTTNHSLGNTGSSSLFPPQSIGSVFHRAISAEPTPQATDRFAQRRLGSEPPGSRTPDSTRTFGQESSLFGDARIGTPSRNSSSGNDSLIPTIEEESLLETGDNYASIRSRLLHSRRQEPEMPLGPVRSPIAIVADRPAPDMRPLQSTRYAPVHSEPPSTPVRDLRPPTQSPPETKSTASRIAPRASEVLPPRETPRNLAARSVSPTLLTNSVRRTTHHVSRDSPAQDSPVRNQDQHHPPPDPVSPSPVRSALSRHNIFTKRIKLPPLQNQLPPIQNQPPPIKNQLPPIQNQLPAVQNQFPPIQNQHNAGRAVSLGLVNGAQRPFSAAGTGRNTRGENHTSTAQPARGLFTPAIQESIEKERQQDEAEQQALRSERKARIQAFPRLYYTIYRWTNTARPDTPTDADSDAASESSWQPPRQIPTNQYAWGPWIMFTFADGLVDVLTFLFSPDAWLIRAALGSAIASFVGWTVIAGLASIPARGLGGFQWYGLTDVSHNLGQFVPLWMSRPSTVFADEDTREYVRQQRDHEYEITKLVTANKLHEGSLAKLQQIVPKVVHMSLDKHGRPVVTQEFYHALRDLMKGDTEVLTLDRGHGGYHFISEEHWRAIRDRLRQDPVYKKAASPPDPGVSTTEVEAILQNNLSKSWEKWLKNNNKKVAKILEPAFGTSIPDKIEKDLGAKLEQYVKDLYKEKGTKDIVVTREEFLRHLKGEFVVHRREVKAEAQEMQQKLEQYVTTAVDAAMSKAPPAGITRPEVMKMVDMLIRETLSNAALEALAKGKIGANWNSQLRREVNFLLKGNGALIDPKHTSPTYDPVIDPNIGSLEWRKSTARSPDVPGPWMTLYNWDDEGECWCGSPTVDHEGKPHGVFISYLLSHEVIPRHVVIEHILPTATLDPDARPRDMEIWAYIAELNLRDRVEDFSATHFPTPSSNWIGDGWVKIGQFTYESNDALDGVHVHQLSPELVALGAATDQIVIRAVNNYGSDHTCIYRARLFGDRLT